MKAAQSFVLLEQRCRPLLSSLKRCRAHSTRLTRFQLTALGYVTMPSVEGTLQTLLAPVSAPQMAAKLALTCTCVMCLDGNVQRVAAIQLRMESI
jgi:hypothetical protein